MKRMLLLVTLLWLTAGILYGAQAANVSCNYASSGAANTQCVVVGEMYMGISQIHMEERGWQQGDHGRGTNCYAYITFTDGSRTGEFFCGTNYDAGRNDDALGQFLIYESCSQGKGGPTCRASAKGGRLNIFIQYQCTAGVGNCRQGDYSVRNYYLDAPRSNGTQWGFTRQWSGNAGSCIEKASYSSSYDTGSTTITCSGMAIPAGWTFISNFYVPQLSPVNAFDYSGDMLGQVYFGIDGSGGKTYPYYIAFPQASCNSPAVSSYVFWATGTTNYTLHSKYKNDSVIVQLRPQQNISNCTHNVYGWAGADGWYRTTAKLAIKSESSSCDKGVTNSYSTWLDGADTVINWTISGLSTLAGGTQVNCTHNLVTELTWY
ncbi:hypothetical protein [Superficieibacter electus]|nr:hypothetical protein [Superficieibacter electus]